MIWANAILQGILLGGLYALFAAGLSLMFGVMRFINIDTCKLLFDIGALDNRIHHVTVSPTGRHIVGVMESGNLQVFDVRALSAEINKVILYLKSLIVFVVLMSH